VEDLVRPRAADAGERALVAQERMEAARLATQDLAQRGGADAERIRTEMRDFRLRSVTVGEVAQGEAQIEAEYDGRSITGRAVSTDIIEASALAFLQVINRIAMRKKLLIALTFIAVTAASYPLWKPLAKRNKWFVIATNVGLDSLRRYGLNSGQIGQKAVVSFPESQIPGDVKKIQDIYGQYLHYSGWSPTAVAGKRVLELGPGFTIGVPLMFAADGASFVAGLDKFVRLQDGPYFRALYARIRGTLSNEQKAAFDRTIRLHGGTVRAANAPDGGLVVELTLPAAA